MWAHRLQPRTYADLIDAGWRRSGCWLYRPEARTCCPAHTIRLDAGAFAPSRAQRRALARLDAYLAGGALPGGGGGDAHRPPRGASPPFGAPFGGGAPPARGASPVGGVPLSGAVSPAGGASPERPPPRSARILGGAKRKGTPAGAGGARPPRRVASGLVMSASSLDAGGGGQEVAAPRAALAAAL